MAKTGISLTVQQRDALAAALRRHGAEAVCEAANVRSTQSLYRAISGATVLRMTSAALLAAGERLTIGSTPETAGEIR